MRRNNRITERVDRYFYAISLAAPIFTLFIYLAVLIQNFIFAIRDNVIRTYVQVPLNSADAHFGRVNFIRMIKQYRLIFRHFTPRFA